MQEVIHFTTRDHVREGGGRRTHALVITSLASPPELCNMILLWQPQFNPCLLATKLKLTALRVEKGRRWGATSQSYKT